MSINVQTYNSIIQQLTPLGITLVAVSKTKPAEDIRELYNLGQRHFGENYVQELTDKQQQLPNDIHWHFIGHLQSNKVKYIAPFVYLIHGVDSLKLLNEINKQAQKNNRVINCLLQVHIATEETKFGFDEAELLSINTQELAGLKNVQVTGLMGMASFTDNMEKVRQEFKTLKALYNKFSVRVSGISHLTTLSMGMSSDYKIAIEEGTTMVRIGSLLFGAREYANKG